MQLAYQWLYILLGTYYQSSMYTKTSHFEIQAYVKWKSSGNFRFRISTRKKPLFSGVSADSLLKVYTCQVSQDDAILK